jgi:hypothetical protein
LEYSFYFPDELVLLPEEDEPVEDPVLEGDVVEDPDPLVPEELPEVPVELLPVLVES